MVSDNKISTDPPKQKINSILQLLNSNKLIEAKKEVNQQLLIYINSSILFNILGAVLVGQNKLQEAVESYNMSIKINPNYFQAYNNLGACFYKLYKFNKAIEVYQKAIKIQSNNPDIHNNIGALFTELKEYKKSIIYFEKAIEIQSNHQNAHYNLGIAFKQLENSQKAMNIFKKVIKINPKHASAHYNLGLVFYELGDLQNAKNCFEKTIEINPRHANANNNLGIVFNELGEIKKAINFFRKTIEIQPNYSNAYWCLHSFAENIDEALKILIKAHNIEKEFLKAEIMISALKGYKGDFDDFNRLNKSTDSTHPYMRSIRWVFSLPKLPEIFFNQWSFFDSIVSLTNKERPFYEFGVRNGISFKYLISKFGKGFGFDTFTGLPESWGKMPKGGYSTFGSVPKIVGGKFIVGEFKNTLPKFFSNNRPFASLINFDADLYSSTLCALNYSKKIIDEKTILIFDEFLMNEKWENDEYKALNEFCDIFNMSYEVLAVSFFSKQIAIKLKKV